MSDQNESDDELETLREGLSKTTPSFKKRAYEAFAMAALGVIPWIGGFISAAAGLHFNKDDVDRDNLQTQWLEEHTTKLKLLQETLEYITNRFSNIGDDINDRIQSDEYLNLVRKSFRVWDNADTNEKRKYVADLIANATSLTISSDDVVRLFIEWLDRYNEVHFAVIKEIYQKPGSTRYDIWKSIHGDFPKENSAEADLFRMIIHDLSLGNVIRIERETTEDGQFIKKRNFGRASTSSRTMESAFEDTKPYELTALGTQFVHYAMTELVPRFGPEDQGQ
jgi:hypothetical protein